MNAIDEPAFRASLRDPTPPEGIGDALLALWWYGRGDWDRAHRHAMAQDDAESAAVHALLHRHEGDLANARYWYRRAGRPEATGALEAEWASLLTAFTASG